ncbi:lipopolysaccharide heptosyltransferase II, partial [Vibrio sp. 1262-1]|uniref:lipopolysaccharide heptosyltransferase II n=1 Tax=Vibrio sp. 1262-1 TaxID=3074548 RepID=UPI002964FF89
NIPLRTGWKGEMRYGLLNDLRPNMKSFQYMVERYVALAYPKAEMVDSNSLGGLETLPRPRLAINAAEQLATIKKFNLAQDQTIIGLCPGAEFGPAKKWPETHYAEVATQMARSGHQIWLFGSQKDLETCNNIRALVPTQFHEDIHVLAGQTSLIEAVDLLAACKTVVANDS